MSRKRRTRRSRKSRKPKNSLLSWVFIITAPLALISGAVFLTTLRTNSEAISADTQCHKTILPEVTMILVDSSDSLDSVQIEVTISRILRIAEKQESFSRFDIYSARPDGLKLLSPIFQACIPPKPSSPLFSDAKAAEEFETNFRLGLEEALGKAVGLPSSKTSPLLESIREASTSSFSRIPETTRRRLIVVSDMLQNSKAYTHYNGIKPFSDFKSSSGWAKAITNLENAQVTVFYIARPESRNLQGIAHQEWWRAYFDAVNGYLLDLETF